MVNQATAVEGIYKKVSSRIDSEWYPYHREEWFSQDDICRNFNWREPSTKQAVSKKLYHDSHEKNPASLEKNGKVYRLIDEECEEIDWQSADPENVWDISLPFGLHNLVKFYPKSIIVVAGEPNAGKTALMYNVIIMNMHKYRINLFNSETSKEVMLERFNNFDIEIPEPAPFITRERYENFADVIDPDGFNVIDYIDADNEFWAIGAEISKLYRKLNKGIVVCAIQKRTVMTNFKGQKIETELGYGGSQTLKRAALYVTMTRANRLKIIKGKSWKDKTVNPNGMEWSYKLVGGAKFVQIERIYQDGF